MPARLCFLLLAATAGGDEAVRGDGSRSAGTLTFAAGRFAWDGKPPEGIDLVRFAGDRKAGAGVRIRLTHDELVIGQVVRLDAERLHVKPAWTEALALPRPLIESVGPEKPWADRSQDAVRTADGDETYGTLTEAKADSATLVIEGKPRSLPWASLAFRRTRSTEKPTQGEHVQARLRTGDVIHGVVTRFEADALGLRHAGLGDLTVPRSHLAELRLLFHGRRVPVDTSPRHLGSKASLDYAVRMPEGMGWNTTLAESGSGFVVVDAVQVASPVDVLLDGELLGTIRTDRVQPEWRTFRFPLPAKRRGEFGLKVREPSEGRPTRGLDLRGVRLELSDPGR